jgi:hypothetical protein
MMLSAADKLLISLGGLPSSLNKEELSTIHSKIRGLISNELDKNE